MNCTMSISVGVDSTTVENPAHIPHVGEEVTIQLGKRRYSGVVISVSHDFTDENEQFISVKAR